MSATFLIELASRFVGINGDSGFVEKKRDRQAKNEMGQPLLEVKWDSHFFVPIQTNRIGTPTFLIELDSCFMEINGDSGFVEKK